MEVASLLLPFGWVFFTSCICCWEQYRGTTCTLETGTQKSDFLINCCFLFLAKHSLVLGAFQLPKSHCRCQDICFFPLLQSPYCDHEGGRWLFLSWWLVKGPVHSSFSFLWFLLYSLFSACFRSELTDSRRDPPKQTDAILKHSSPPKQSIYP